MKIDINSPFINKKDQRVSGKADKPQSAANTEQKSPSQEASGDVVQLSDRSKLIAKAQELASQAPEVRADRVQDIRNRIDAGTYNVSGRTVADAMLKKTMNTIV